MDMTPQAWPEWYDGRHINEVLFCQQFLDKHPMKYVPLATWMRSVSMGSGGEYACSLMLASRFATVLERLAVSTPEISSRMRLPI